VFRFEIPIRFADLDALAHVNNVRALEFLQEARVAMTRELGYAFEAGSLGQHIEGLGQYIVRIENDYVSPIQMQDGRVIVESGIERIGTSSYTIAHTASVPDGRVVLRARAVMVCVNATSGSSAPIPDGWRSAMKAHLVRDGD